MSPTVARSSVRVEVDEEEGDEEETVGGAARYAGGRGSGSDGEEEDEDTIYENSVRSGRLKDRAAETPFRKKTEKKKRGGIFGFIRRLFGS